MVYVVKDRNIKGFIIWYVDYRGRKIFLDLFRFLSGFEHETHKERLIEESVQIYVIFVVQSLSHV